MNRNNRFFLTCFQVLLILLLFSGSGQCAENTASLSLSAEEPLSFYNGVYHYITVNAEAHGADQLVMRVYKPDGSQARFNVRRRGKNEAQAGMSASFQADENDNYLSGSKVLFLTKCDPGIWKIEVTALRNKEELLSAFLPVEVKAYGKIIPTEYETAYELVTEDDEEHSVVAGQVRFVAQMPKDHCFINRFWKSKYYDLTGSAKTKCTRAVLSMGLSWLGIDCTPVRMSEITKSQEIFHTYEHVIQALGNIEQIDGNLEDLWGNYLRGEASPIEIHFNFESGMHALLLIHRDSTIPELYYAVNPGDGVNATAYGGKKHDHIIPILIEQGEIGCMIQSPLVKRFHKGKLDVICQWKLTERTEE